MRKVNASVNFLIIFVLLLSTGMVNGQGQFAPQDGSSIQYTIANVVLKSDRILEFDLYLKNVEPSKPFELSIAQAGILVNSEITNGGNTTATVVQGFSDLNDAQKPNKTLWVKGTPNSIIKLAPKVCPGPGKGTIISTTGLGTRICRLQITNSVPFAKARPNLTFCFTSVPYPTKIFEYKGRVSIQLTTNSANCFNKDENPMLNQ